MIGYNHELEAQANHILSGDLNAHHARDKHDILSSRQIRRRKARELSVGDMDAPVGHITAWGQSYFRYKENK